MFHYGSGYVYYLGIALTIFCAIHCLNRGTAGRWLWIIIVFPFIGSLIYIYSEILSSRNFRAPSIDIGAVINPGGKIKKLEEQLRFTDTFANRVKLADAYLDAGFTDKAVDLYTGSLTGAFAENEHVLAQLVIAYYRQEAYEKVIPIARKIYKLPQFARSKAHIAYAKSLEALGDTALAENEFKAMKGRYSYFGPRYEYGLFLIRAGREEDAAKVFNEMLNEEQHLGQMEKKSNRQWFSLAREALKQLG